MNTKWDGMGCGGLGDNKAALPGMPHGNIVETGRQNVKTRRIQLTFILIYIVLDFKNTMMLLVFNVLYLSNQNADLLFIIKLLINCIYTYIHKASPLSRENSQTRGYSLRIHPLL